MGHANQNIDAGWGDVSFSKLVRQCDFGMKSFPGIAMTHDVRLFSVVYHKQHEKHEEKNKINLYKKLEKNKNKTGRKGEEERK